MLIWTLLIKMSFTFGRKKVQHAQLPRFYMPL